MDGARASLSTFASLRHVLGKRLFQGRLSGVREQRVALAVGRDLVSCQILCGSHLCRWKQDWPEISGINWAPLSCHIFGQPLDLSIRFARNCYISNGIINHLSVYLPLVLRNEVNNSKLIEGQNVHELIRLQMSAEWGNYLVWLMRLGAYWDLNPLQPLSNAHDPALILFSIAQKNRKAFIPALELLAPSLVP